MINGSVKIRMEFITLNGSHSDATNIELRVYTVTNTLIETITITESNKVGTGIYEAIYTVPQEYTEVIGEVSGYVGNELIVGKVSLVPSTQDELNVADYLEDVKTVLNIPLDNTTQDDTLKRKIPYGVDFIQTYCKRDFKNNAGQIDLPKGLRKILGQMIVYDMQSVAVSSLKFGTFSVDSETSYPNTIMSTLDTYMDRRVIMRG